MWTAGDRDPALRGIPFRRSDVNFTDREILETVRMVEMEALDIRTVTMGISLRDCMASNMDEVCHKVRDKITRYAGRLVAVCEEISGSYGIPIVNRRLSVTPVSLLGEPTGADDYTPIAVALDDAARGVGIDFVGGFSAMVQKGFTKGDHVLLRCIPTALASTETVCGSVNLASTKCGINMDAVKRMGHIIKQTAFLTRHKGGIGCAKLVVFCNAPEDNPFMAGAFLGIGEPECVIDVGVSGPGVVRHALEQLGPDADLGEVAEIIKKTAFKITRAGELAGREAARRLGVKFGIVDLSLAPTPLVGDSVADILELMGLEGCGTHGSTAALALLTDAVKKGGAMASSYVGGLSGAFIPVSEDAGMIEAVERGAMSLEKLEAMSSVCSVGLDMIAVPGDTSPETISAIIADEMAIGMINNKCTGVRILVPPGKKVGERVEFGGLLGSAPVMAVSRFDASAFIRRGGRIPAPITSLTN
jgi:uncharacterized protein (UPF0210 family)